jgi:hypothetical protein
LFLRAVSSGFFSIPEYNVRVPFEISNDPTSFKTRCIAYSFFIAPSQYIFVEVSNPIFKEPASWVYFPEKSLHPAFPHIFLSALLNCSRAVGEMFSPLIVTTLKNPDNGATGVSATIFFV